MYADLEKIEARGKRKKEKSKGLFSSFGKKEEPEPDERQQAQPEPPITEAPKSEPITAQPPPPKPAPPPPVMKPAPAQPSKPAETAAKPAIEQPPKQKPQGGADRSWKPLTGSKLKKAEDELIAYKKWLNHGFKSGVLTKQECVAMVQRKKVELGLQPAQ
ncbi:MAG: hypothetical protein R6W91_04040 [Thermoplasmata archaeon]